MPVFFPDVEDLVCRTGLTVRGGLHPCDKDNVLGKPSTLILVGNFGPDMWATFSRVSDQYANNSNPLDDWVRDQLNAVAEELGASVLFPFGGPPFLPFQRWAQKAEPVASSPLGILINPEYGLWHAWRGALAFDEVIELPQRDKLASPCESCVDKPCLSACPVGAFGLDGYDVLGCVTHIETLVGSDCMELGCRARRACPVGRAYTYEPAQAAFHMHAFRAAQRGGS
ncbi:MAG: hypothetical protein OSB67_02330 [Alphaproteobacteria bacterium]|nr:hypothetical protein [Alphaproteobacteria bacterium]